MRPFITLSTILVAAATILNTACEEPSDIDMELVEEAADDEQDPLAASQELARAWLHAFRRYLVGFPGGASPLEQEFAERLEATGLTDAELRVFVANVEATLAMDLGESPVDDLMLDEPLTAALLKHLMPPLDLAAAPDTAPPPAACPPVAAFDTSAKYRVKIEGISSLKKPSNDYEYIPYDYQGEEAYVTWSLFTPTSRSSGRTNVAKPLIPTIQMKFTSGATAPSTLGSISSDSLLLFRVIEQDGSFYNTSLTAAQAAASTMAPMIDWVYVNTFGKLPTEVAAVYDTLSKSGSANDDVFELEQLGFTEKRLWEITNGCTTYPSEFFPFKVPTGSYWEYAMRVVDSSAKWNTWVTFNRL